MRAANAALAAVRAEINKIEMEKARLEQDSEAGGIKGARAKNELAQLLSRDKTDLNRALLTAEAAVRKVRPETYSSSHPSHTENPKCALRLAAPASTFLPPSFGGWSANCKK